MPTAITNRRPSPRDDAVAAVGSADVAFLDFKDQVIFERDEVLTQGGTPFSVFTPNAALRAWLRLAIWLP